MKKYLTPAMLAAVLFGVEAASAAPVLQPGDFAIAIDTDPLISLSSYPTNEFPENAFDAVNTTKYLNFGELQTGLIVTPFAGSTTIQSMRLTTANDAVERDPLNWEVWGTNNAIDHNAPGIDNGTSIIPGVNWTLISSGAANLPDARLTAGPVYSFANANAYTSYRVLFPSVKNPTAANSMQIAEIELFPSLDGPASSGTVLSVLDEASAIQLPQPQSRYPAGQGPAAAIDGLAQARTSNFPAAEGPGNVVDGTNNKYLNFGEEMSGFIVTPASGASTLRSFQITTANDAEPRDPASYELYGTNDAITSVSNDIGTAENWTLISSGALTLPTGRNTLGDLVPVTNSTSYTSYKMLFPTVKDAVAANSMQIAEASFFSTADGTGADILNAGDPVLAIDATVLLTKYLNFGEENSGLIVTPVAGAKTVTSLQITTGNDSPERDPTSYQIYGTNSPITSAEHSDGTAESWTLIASGDLALPEARDTAGDVITFANGTAYSSYKILFPTVKDATLANSVQIAGLQLFDSSVAADPDKDGDGDVDGQDLLAIQRGGSIAADLAAWKAGFSASAAAIAGAVPEPASAALALVGVAAAALARRKRD